MMLNKHAKMLTTIGSCALGASAIALIRVVKRHMDMDEDEVRDDDFIIEEDEMDPVDTKSLWDKIAIADTRYLTNSPISTAGITFHSSPGFKHTKKDIRPGQEKPVPAPTVPFKVRTVVNSEDKPFTYKIEDGVVIVSVVEGYIPRLNDTNEPDKDGVYNLEVEEPIAVQLRDLANGTDSPNLRGTAAYSALHLGRVSTSAYKDTDSGYRACKYFTPAEEMGNIVYPEANEKLNDEYDWANVPQNPYGAVCSNPDRIKRLAGNAPLMGCSELPNNTVCQDYVADDAVPVTVKLTNGTQTDGIKVRTINPFDSSVRAEVFADTTRITGANYELTTTKDDEVDRQDDNGSSPLRSINRKEVAV